MDLHDFLDPARIAVGVNVTSKRHSLEKLAAMLAPAADVDPALLKQALMEREKLGSTGAGKGVAIPHAHVRHTGGVYGALITLRAPIDFDAVDEAPVDILAAIVACEDCGSQHLMALAAMSRLLRQDSLLDKLRAAEDPEAVLALLVKASG